MQARRRAPRQAGPGRRRDISDAAWLCQLAEAVRTRDDAGTTERLVACSKRSGTASSSRSPWLPEPLFLPVSAEG